MKPLVFITGPTGSGKSSLAVRLAHVFDAEIISADSMQIYKHMNIGTAKITKEEMQGIPHHMIDFLELNETFSVADYVKMTRIIIDDIVSRGKQPFIVGGTTLYIQSLVDNIQFFDLPENTQLREELADYALKNGNNALWNKLNFIDPDLAKVLHENNLGRVTRAIEVFETTGKTMSKWQAESKVGNSKYRQLLVGLNYSDRSKLYTKINQRIDNMLILGLVEEAKRIFEMAESKTARQAIGYKEIWQYLDGKSTLEQACIDLKMQTRRYAKRQITWLNSRKDLKFVKIDDANENDTFEEISLMIKTHLLGV